jgi:hypothetical protein
MFRTELITPESKIKLNYQSKIMSLGSCFSEHMGDKLQYFKFDTLINPFGIIYNPQSIAQSLQLLLKNKSLSESDLFEHEGVWNSFLFHSRFSGLDKEKVLASMNRAIAEGSAFLKQANVLMLTFGTAWVYELKRTGKIVANCHKVPAKEFTRYRLSVCDIVDLYKGMIKQLKNQHIDLQIILTVSPVRHLKDGFHENQLSKSVLLMAVNDIVSSFDKVSYFPSYEIMMDDLRDYRFYNSDMVHPSPMAIAYIWNKFLETHINSQIKSTMQSIDKIRQAANHRPFQPNSESHQKFIKKQLKQITELKKHFGGLNFSDEEFIFQSQLNQV